MVLEPEQDLAADRVPPGTVAVAPGGGPSHLQTDLGPSLGLGPSLVPQFVGPQGPGLALEPERDLAADRVPPGAVAVTPGGGP